MIRGYQLPMHRRSAGGNAERTWSIIESARVVRPMGTQR